MSIRLLAVGVAAALLAGCASSYQAPQGDNVARLRLVSPQTSMRANTHALAYPSGMCQEPMSLGMVGGLSQLVTDKPLGIPGADSLKEKTYFERTIPAGKRYLVTTRSLVGLSSCVVTFSFLPQAGKDYSALVRWENNGECVVTLDQVRQEASGNVVLQQERSAVREKDCTKGLH